MNLIVLEEWKSKILFAILKYVEESNEKEIIRVAKMADAHALQLEPWDVARVNRAGDEQKVMV